MSNKARPKSQKEGGTSPVGEGPPADREIVIKYPGKHDVMLGRGGESNFHSGNLTFRQFVKQFKEEYQAASRHEKTDIALKVVHCWRDLDPPGSFLERTNPDEADSTWREVGDKIATKRTLKNLGERETKPESQPISKAKGTKRPRVSAETKVDGFPGIRNRASHTTTNGFQTGQSRIGYACSPAEYHAVQALGVIAMTAAAQTNSNPMAASPQLGAAAGLQSWRPPFLPAILQMHNQQPQQQHQQQQQQPLNFDSALAQGYLEPSNLRNQPQHNGNNAQERELPTAASLTAGAFSGSECSGGSETLSRHGSEESSSPEEVTSNTRPAAF